LFQNEITLAFIPMVTPPTVIGVPFTVRV